jgi:hypothetical protein
MEEIVKKRFLFVSFVGILMIGCLVMAQMTPWKIWTLIPADQMDEIIGEASGETAWNTILETGGYNKNRQADEYAGTFYEAQYIYDQLKRYGLPGAEIVRFKGGKTWDGIKGELWEIEPKRQKLASYQDLRAMLASGSNSADVKAELVWVGRGTEDEIKGAEVEGKIVVTEGRMSTVHNSACMKHGALGVISMQTSRPYFDPLQIPWSGLRGFRQDVKNQPKFGFFMPIREGAHLKERLLRGEKIKVHAQVESKMEPYELQVVGCHMPGTETNGDELIFSAHLFEGYTKQGANDNKSGSATILEVARLLHRLIEEGRLPKPKRTIRFIWVPEFSGTIPWVKANKDIMERTLCNINMDMVGEWLSKNQAFMTLARTTYGNAHYINDVMENYYRYIGEANIDRWNARGKLRRIVAPSGSEEPFYYLIDTHSGASDHEVFNDWGVQVPGVAMNAWPDQWYHTSGDRADKADPTQLKRASIIGAAAAFTIVNADDFMAKKIAGETTSNGTRRLGHQLVIALEMLNDASPETLADSYKAARALVEAASNNEMATIATVIELAADKKDVESYLENMKMTIASVAKAHLAALDAHMKGVAQRLDVKPVKIEWNELEEKASKIVPRSTAKVKENGYRGYSQFITKVPKADRDKFPYSRRDIASTSELHCLIDGKRSVLDIKHGLDAQYQRKSKLASVLNYIQILKLADLVDF